MSPIHYEDKRIFLFVLMLNMHTQARTLKKTYAYDPETLIGIF